MVNSIKKVIKESIETKLYVLEDELLINQIESIIELIVNAYKNNKKVFFCGNGGSAADAQHLAAELSGRFYFDRDPLYAEALHVNTSYITAVANDYSYDVIYSRYIKAAGNEGDVLIGLSTSGKSKNVLNAFYQAKEKGMKCIGLTGVNHVDFSNICDNTISIPSTVTPRIQECHLMIGHIICEKVEELLFNNTK